MLQKWLLKQSAISFLSVTFVPSTFTKSGEFNSWLFGSKVFVILQNLRVLVNIFFYDINKFGETLVYIISSIKL